MASACTLCCNGEERIPYQIQWISVYEKPLKKNEEGEAMYDYDDDSASRSGCGCLRFLGFRPQRKRNDNESKYLLQQKGELRESWWKNKLNKVRQVTEVSAGPKWKTFVRKFNGFGINKNKKDRNKFQYDPKSYALNFDGGFDCEEDDLVLGFSSRFAAPIHNHKEQRRTGTPVLIG